MYKRNHTVNLVTLTSIPSIFERPLSYNFLFFLILPDNKGDIRVLTRKKNACLNSVYQTV